MLCLSRKVGECITLTVGDVEVHVHVLRLRRGRMCLGVDAPRSVRIRRRELAEPPETRPQREVRC